MQEKIALDDVSAQQRSRRIIQAIRSEEQYWRKRYPSCNTRTGLAWAYYCWR
jgi:hypothetical protein